MLARSFFLRSQQSASTFDRMHPSESESLNNHTVNRSFDEVSSTIFDGAFDFYGTLDRAGRIISLRGRILEKTNANAELLSGQHFSETVFWQSSENTARLVDKALGEAAGGAESSLLVDFRVSAEEKVPVELRLQPLGP